MIPQSGDVHGGTSPTTDTPANGTNSDGILPFLNGLDAAGWALLRRHGEARVFAAGDVLVREGETDDAIFILEAGAADVIVGGDEAVAAGSNSGRIVARLPQGSVFGEIAFFDSSPRSATVRAVNRGRSLCITRAAFDQLAAWEPVLGRRILLELGRVLAMRLRWVQGQSLAKR